jgi:3-oxoacyl-[acyl-carrier protein] reductase
LIAWIWLFERNGVNPFFILPGRFFKPKEEKMELKGKVAIVTGAGQGLGKAIALELAKAGANLVLADIREDTMAQVKREIEATGREAVLIRVDVSQWKDAEAMARKTLEKYGRIDILVNNAGISPRAKGGGRLRIIDIEDADWDRVLNINLKGVFNCSKAVIPTMMNQEAGKIVNMGSIAGITGGAGSPASGHYCISKAGVISLTKVMARELAPYNINVNAIAPGRIETEMAATASPETNEEARRQTPLGRFGKPIDIARAVLFLVSESGNFIAGETMIIDGGRVMQ